LILAPTIQLKGISGSGFLLPGPAHSGVPQPPKRVIGLSAVSSMPTRKRPRSASVRQSPGDLFGAPMAAAGPLDAVDHPAPRRKLEECCRRSCKRPWRGRLDGVMLPSASRFWDRHSSGLRPTTRLPPLALPGVKRRRASFSPSRRLHRP
jgi:hypothetical protein